MPVIKLQYIRKFFQIYLPLNKNTGTQSQHSVPLKRDQLSA